MLSINIWDLLWTFVNFFLLYFVLKTLLYKPIVRFMDERRTRIEAGLEEERKLREAMEANAQALLEKKEQCRLEAKRILDAAQAEDSAQREAQSAQLKQELLLKREELRQDVRQQQAQDAERFNAQEAELAAVLADRLLKAGG